MDPEKVDDAKKTVDEAVKKDLTKKYKAWSSTKTGKVAKGVTPYVIGYGANALAGDKEFNDKTTTGYLANKAENIAYGAGAAATIASLIPGLKKIPKGGKIGTVLSYAGLGLTAMRGMFGENPEKKPTEEKGDKSTLSAYDAAQLELETDPNSINGESIDKTVVNVINGSSDAAMGSYVSMPKFTPPPRYQLVSSLYAKYGTALAMANDNAINVFQGESSDSGKASNVFQEISDISSAINILDDPNTNDDQKNIAALYTTGVVTGSKEDATKTLLDIKYKYDELNSKIQISNLENQAKAKKAQIETLTKMANKSGVEPQYIYQMIEGLRKSNDSLQDDIMKGYAGGKNQFFINSPLHKSIEGKITNNIIEMTRLKGDAERVANTIKTYYKYVGGYEESKQQSTGQ